MHIQWKDAYLVGDHLIDFDHQMLINVSNELFNEIENGTGHEVIEKTIHCLNDYIDRHFAHEEAMFLDTDYPDADEHIKTHREIEKIFRGIETAYNKDPHSLDPGDMLNFINRWLVRHILKVDREYIPYMEKAALEPDEKTA
ncbi:MAG TPA: bacteriohemerythrin [Alphaproteobacteria bacterium]|nr:bacteriohemerythrin [Alphaproteobacteria bacterium]